MSKAAGRFLRSHAELPVVILGPFRTKRRCDFESDTTVGIGKAGPESISFEFELISKENNLQSTTQYLLIMRKGGIDGMGEQ